MSSCCSGDRRDVPGSPCPRCGEVGRPVGLETVLAIVKHDRLEPTREFAPRFCRTPICAVLYYGADGRVIDKDAAAVRVGLKETQDPIPLCYCFGFTREQVRKEVEATGDSTIPDRIEAEIRAGRCSCERKNPTGSCCLGDVRREVKEAIALLVAQNR